MFDQFPSEIPVFGGTFSSRGRAFYQSQSLSFSLNSALVSIFGATYGSDEQVTFSAQDLRGEVSMGACQICGTRQDPLSKTRENENAISSINKYYNKCQCEWKCRFYRE